MLLETRRIWWLVGALILTVSALLTVLVIGTSEPQSAAATTHQSRPDSGTAVRVLTTRRSLPVDGCLRLGDVGARWAPC